MDLNTCDRKEGLPELIRVHYPEDSVKVGQRFKVIISKRGAAVRLLYSSGVIRYPWTTITNFETVQ